MKKIFIYTLLSVLFSVGCFAQKVLNTIEVETKPGNYVTIVETFEKSKKFLVCYSDPNDAKKSRNFMYEYYDQTMKSISNGSFPMGYKSFPLKTIKTENEFCIVLKNNDKDNITVCVFNFGTGKFEYKDAAIPASKIGNLSDFFFNNNKLYTVYTESKKIFFCSYDFKEDKLKTVEFVGKDRKLKFKDLQIINAANKETELNLVLTNKNDEAEIYIFKESKIQKSDSLVISTVMKDKAKRVSFSVNHPENAYLISGTYSKDWMYFNGSNTWMGAIPNNGIYISKLSNDKKLIFDTLYNFLDIPNFTNYLELEEKQKIEAKQDKKAVKGKELNIDYNALIYELIHQDGKYIQVIEFYKEKYITLKRENTFTKKMEK